jgi:hypothetical protein
LRRAAKKRFIGLELPLLFAGMGLPKRANLPETPPAWYFGKHEVRHL